jgi:hypothetical protein
MKKLLGAVLVIGATVMLWPRTHDANLVYDRLWVDHMPRTETDRFELFAALTEQPIGIFQASSVWKGEWELFRHEGAGDGKLLIIYPQTGKRERVAYKARTCREQGFDYCLELDASHGAKRYYSQKGWELRSIDQIQSLSKKALRQ